MLHARRDYQQIQDPSGKIGDDEPVMVFRAKDELAPRVMFEYARLLTVAGASNMMIHTVIDHAIAMCAWQKNNGKKCPDMPPDASIYRKDDNEQG